MTEKRLRELIILGISYDPHPVPIETRYRRFQEELKARKAQGASRRLNDSTNQCGERL